MGNRAISLLAVTAAAGAAACGGRDTQPESPGSQRPAADVSELRVPHVDPELCEPSGKEVVTYDLNHDGEPNIWELYKTIEEDATDVEVMTCKQVDFDGDGVKDYVANYRESGELLAEEFDLTFDGSFDVRSHYDDSGNMVLTERASGFGEGYDVWERYTDEGELELVQRDRSGDGQPDMWEQYEGGELVAILYDDTSDGRVDRREERPRGDEEETEEASGEDELAGEEPEEELDSDVESDDLAPAE